VEAVKTLIRNAFHQVGYDLVKFPRVSRAKKHYEPITPFATYSPWNLDSQFLETYAAVRHHTLVDLYRCYELWKLVEQVANVEGAIIEVGVWRGGTGALIAKKAQICGLGCPVYLCDTFAGVPKACDQDGHYSGGEHADTSRALVESLAARLGVGDVRILEGIFPEESAHAVENTMFRLCHIDVDVYQSAKDIVEWIWHRMPQGGIIVLDDYGTCGCEGITKCVDEQADLPDRVVLYNLNGHALAIKTATTGVASAKYTASPPLPAVPF